MLRELMNGLHLRNKLHHSHGAPPTERQICVWHRSVAPAECQIFRYLLADEQYDANIGVAVFTYAIFSVLTRFAEETYERGERQLPWQKCAKWSSI
ncbi:hypothetical protein MA16_Dca005204 [Dendrobium catenatum]|uniref:Uncharacterized protein n=1 Tax=Dendrobium catenatum TaxID=906689 RepID=A0A2I0VLL4_9ASPA|nr:hypothetical protein MA16_Dca005204 [Dendrobium catenatum]